MKISDVGLKSIGGDRLSDAAATNKTNELIKGMMT